MRFATILAAAILSPAIVFAAGSSDTNPPKTTKTAAECKAGEVWDKKTKTCLDSQSNLIDDDTRYDAVRELAYDAQYDRALQVLASMSDQSESRVWTYKGFIARKSGDMDKAMEFYAAALDANADNILARSYMGQAFVTIGDDAAAKIQLTEIRTRGGRNTWAEHSLETAISSGKTFNY
jgi:tetratricopeptide (TPR) repeat protein